MNYQYKRLDNNNFTVNSLDGFVRHQTVAECWRKTDNDWKLVSNVPEMPDTSNWSWRRLQRIKMPLPCTRAWAFGSTAETRRASAHGCQGGRSLSSCGWSLTGKELCEALVWLCLLYRIIKVEDGLVFYQKRRSGPNRIFR